MGNKKFYWIKLRTDFFNQETIDFLLSQKNGAEYVVLYQMLILQTANNEGQLSTRLGEIITPYTIEKIARDTKYFDVDTVAVALEFYKKLGLIYVEENGMLQIDNIHTMVGTESASKEAIKKREYREKLKAVDKKGTNCPTEIENRDKRLENRDKSIEKDTILILGEFENVKLSKIELEKLNENYGEKKTNEMIEKVSNYVEQTGKKYKSHYATILTWIRKDNEKQPKQEVKIRGSSLGDISNLYD